MPTSVPFSRCVHVVVELLQLDVLLLILRVDGVQLLVDRVQLLVRALQLFVRRDQFFVGGLQLFVRGLELLNRRLQVLLRVRQLVLQRMHLVAREAGDVDRGLRMLAIVRHGRALRRGGSERRLIRLRDNGDEDVRERAVRVAHRLGGDCVRARVAGNRQARVADALAIPLRLLQGAADHGSDLVVQHLEQVLRRAPGFDPEQRLDAAVGVQQLAVFIHQKAGGHEPVEQAIVGRQELRADRGATGTGDGRRAHAAAGARQRQLQVARQADVAPLAIDLAVLVHRVELVEQAARALAGAQKQIAARLEREMEQRQDRLLRLRLEVDQHVPAGHQIELGERRVRMTLCGAKTMLSRRSARSGSRSGAA